MYQQLCVCARLPLTGGQAWVVCTLCSCGASELCVVNELREGTLWGGRPGAHERTGQGLA